ncbi:hypothetical protein K402DRAFT_325508 [Aulographum hederae CBS 113979]|uniref:Cohesin loading factor-domain-containing protein n=1 Tax=Aulographum hederae CBS 113979 TaxID=1176131 RepID=A0A6G1HA25_9PEZI|nr:hypothetical protein K402DRAFT_325508 [Aulographum hederae CBS 113979]
MPPTYEHIHVNPPVYNNINVSPPRPQTYPARAQSQTRPAQRPTPQTKPQPQVIVQRKPSTPSSSTSSKITKSKPQRDVPAPFDYSIVLMGLADEYITAARQMGPQVALAQRAEEKEQYYKLVATGMGCMAAALKKYRLQPRAEANLRLRYATLLCEETDNDLEAETVLSKGISLCERNKLLDLKYSMQHLLARVSFKSSPKAALKSVDKLIPDLEAYQHTSWLYAFRFLRVSLSLQLGAHTEVLAAQQHLRHLSSFAENQGDNAIFVTCAAFEAMLHLRSGLADSIEQAQRAIASARSLQLQDSVKDLHQIWTLLDCVDLGCSLQQASHEAADAKMSKMQQALDGAQTQWKDESFTVLIESSASGPLSASTGGILQKSPDGRDMLSFTWLRQKDLYSLGYYLSGVTSYLKHSVTNDKAEKFLREGVKIIQTNLKSPDVDPSSVSGALERTKWEHLLEWYMHLHLTFVLCHRSDWKAAKASLATLERTMDAVDQVGDGLITRWTIYLKGAIAQSSGDSSLALSTFQLPIFNLPESNNHPFDAGTDLSILASMNLLTLIRDPTHPSNDLAGDLLSQLEPFCLTHPNKSIYAALHFLKATCSPPEHITIMKRKQWINISLQTAHAIGNHQILAMAMNFMTHFCFNNILGEQAVKSAKTGWALAKRVKSDMWSVVAGGMLQEKLEVHGRGEDAKKVMEESKARLKGLPDGLRGKCLPGSE